MTEVEMIQAFKVLYDIANLEGPGYDDPEIYVLLNQAQSIEVLKEVKLGRLSFISNLIVNESTDLYVDLAYHYHCSAQLTTGTLLKLLSVKVLLSRIIYKPINEEWVETEEINKEDTGLYVVNNNNLPVMIKPVVFQESGNYIGCMFDHVTTISAISPNCIIEYVRKPTDIAAGVDSIVNETLHERIVNTAVDLGKKVFNPQEAGVSQQTDQIMNNPKV